MNNCPPYQCPNCGEYLDFKADYIDGTPHIHYVCKCGYDTLDELNKIITANTILLRIDSIIFILERKIIIFIT